MKIKLPLYFFIIKKPIPTTKYHKFYILTHAAVLFNCSSSKR